MLEVLDPHHPRFREFMLRLWNQIGDGCTGATDASIRVMTEMGGVDIVNTLRQFGLRNADCDCRILDCAFTRAPDDPSKVRTGFADGDDPDQAEES
jgi:hypothetical protein